MKKPLAVIAAFLVLAAPASAQVPERLSRELAAIYSRGEYAAENAGQIVWLDGGSRYATMTPRGLSASDTVSGNVQVLATAEELKPAGTIASFAFSSDGSRVLLFTNTQRVWRLNTRGDYWAFDLRSRRLQRLGNGAADATLMFAKFSPDATRVAYVRGQNLYVEDLRSGRVTPLTADTSRDVVNGTSDWVNEEELFVRDAFKWSPDGRSIAYLQFDTSRVGRFTLINYTDALYPTLTGFPYPKTGTTNSAVRLGVVAASGGHTRWMAVDGDPREHYIPRFEWINATTLAFHRTARRQNADDLMLADTDTGTVHKVYGETSKTWLDAADPTVMDPVDPAFWLRNATQFTWISDKDGWRHVYLMSRDNGAETLATRFDGDVVALLGLDEPRETLYFIASPQNATQRYLYAASTKDGSVRRITPSAVAGTHSYTISPNGRWALDTYSRADTPPRTDVVSLPDHKVLRTLVSNEALARKAAPLLLPAAEFTQVNIGGDVVLDTLVIKPADFDAARRYPAIVYVYSEPAGTLVNDQWSTVRLMWQAMANEGYVVLMFDNRGTPAPKGAAWRKVVYGAVGELSSQEQAAAVRQFAATHSYVDPSRVAIHGHSGGGSATLNAMFRFPDVYRVGVASAPVPDQRLYDTIYQERYMGLPQENADGYRRGSPINFAEGLRGKLLLMHGTGDDNVHLQGTERLMNRLSELGKDFDVMFYPNRTHALSEGAGTPLHRWTTVLRYIYEHLPPDAPVGRGGPSGPPARQ